MKLFSAFICMLPHSWQYALGTLLGEIAWLADRKISTGWPDKTYRPGNAINRDAMAAFIYRYKHLNR